MSLFARVIPAIRISSNPGRVSVTKVVRPALFSTTVRRETTKDTLKKADRTISNAAVKGIEKGEKATHKIKDTFSSGSKKAGDSAKQAADKVERKGSDFSAEAKEKAEEMTGKA